MTDLEDRLNREIERLPTSIAPRRDLWPGIEERLDSQHAGEAPAAADGTARRAGRAPTPLWGVAATALLVATASLTTFVATRAHYGQQAPGARPPGAADMTQQPDLRPVSGSSVLPVEYTLARGQLMAVLEDSLRTLDPASRRLVLGNLREIRAALATIEQALANDPDNAQLQELLVSTSHHELELLKSIQHMAQATGEVIG